MFVFLRTSVSTDLINQWNYEASQPGRFCFALKTTVVDKLWLTKLLLYNILKMQYIEHQQSKGGNKMKGSKNVVEFRLTGLGGAITFISFVTSAIGFAAGIVIGFDLAKEESVQG